jgi:hypothetical protein
MEEPALTIKPTFNLDGNVKKLAAVFVDFWNNNAMSNEAFCYETCALFKYQAKHGCLPGRPDNCARSVADSLQRAGELHHEDGQTEIETAIGNLLLRLSERYGRMADVCADHVAATPQDQRSSTETVDVVALDTTAVASTVEGALADINLREELQRIKQD